MAEHIQSVLFVSNNLDDSVNLIKLMLGELPKEICEYNIKMYDWHINNKYYESDVKLCSINEKLPLSSEFISSVQAIIIKFDPESPDNLDPVNEWVNYFNEFNAEVKILICGRCNESSKISKLKAQEWCFKEGFELVELEPIIDEQWEAEQDFIETFGIARVKQALEAHVWPNILLKERKDPTTMSGLLNGGYCKSTVTNHETILSNIQDESHDIQEDENISNNQCGTNSIRRAPDNIQPSLDELISDENTTDFCDLFSQLPMMKEKASMLPNEQRKKFAEDVVMAYWKAIGGDKDEILDY